VEVGSFLCFDYSADGGSPAKLPRLVSGWQGSVSSLFFINQDDLITRLHQATFQ
jgi:hypothetical protein